MQWSRSHLETACICLSILGAMALPGCSSGDESRLRHYRSGGSFFGGGPAISPDGNFVVFASPRTGNGDIYRVKIDGTDLMRLTSSPDYECDPHFSPDGLSIAFVREIGRQGDIWLMKSDGSDQRQLTTNAGDEGGPKFASNQFVTFWRTDTALKREVGSSNAREVLFIDIKTGVETRVTNNKIEDVCPDASPDGKYLSFTRGEQTWIYDRTTSVEKRIGEGSDGTFSPDSRQVAVVAGKFGRRIDVMNIDGTERRAIYSKNTTVSRPAYLPDGTGVLFLEEPAGRGVGNVLFVNLENLAVRTVVDTR
jgi:Tol biopolymer transport system component